MGFIKSKRSPPRTKHPTMGQGDELSYISGSGKPSISSSVSAYTDSVERLDTVIRTTADVMSKARPSFYRVDNKGKKTPVKQKQFDDLFMNDYQTYVDFNKLAFSSLLRYNSLLIVPEDSKSPTRQGKVDFFTMDNTKWYLEAGDSGSETIKHFVYRTSTGNEIVYPYKDVIYVANSYDPTNPLYGVPKVQSLNRLIQMELSGTAFIQNYTAQGGKKSLVVTADDFIGQEQRNKIEVALKDYLESTESRVLTLTGDAVKVNPTSDGLDSAQIIELMTYINNSIMESFRMPATLLGRTDISLTKEQLKEQARVFYEIVISPMLITLQLHFSRYIQDVLGAKNIIMEFNTDDIAIFEESLLETLEIVNEKFNRGLYSVNEARRALGDEPLEGEAFDWHFPPQYLQGTGLSYEQLGRGERPPTTEGTISGPGGELNGEGQNGSGA